MNWIFPRLCSERYHGTSTGTSNFQPYQSYSPITSAKRNGLHQEVGDRAEPVFSRWILFNSSVYNLQYPGNSIYLIFVSALWDVLTC